MLVRVDDPGKGEQPAAVEDLRRGARLGGEAGRDSRDHAA
jgi:hypothetical protein